MPDRGPEKDRLLRAVRYVGKSERREYVLAQALVERLAAQHLDNTAEHAEAGIVIREHLAGREQLRHSIQGRYIFLDAVVSCAGVGEDVPLEPGGMTQQLAHRDRGGGRLVSEPELRQVPAHRRVDVQLPFVG